MRDEENRLAFRLEAPQRPSTPLLEIFVADREDLVEQQDVGIQVRRNGESQSHLHAGRVVLQRHVHEVLEPRVLDDGWVQALDVFPRKAVNRRIQVDVFLTRQLNVEADAKLDQRADTGAVRHEQPPGCRTVNAGHELQQRALAGSVAPDQAYRLSLADLER